MKWTINDALRLLAMLAAIAFFSVGLWMVVKGIQADGSIDIQSAVVSGKLHTGSAGLFVLLLSFFIIAFVILPGFAHTGTSSALLAERTSPFKGIFSVFLTLCALEILSWVGAWKGVGLCMTAGVLLIIPLVMSLFGIFAALADEGSRGKPSADKEDTKK